MTRFNIQLRRVLTEKRVYVLPLALALLVNAGVTAFVVLPLRSRVLNALARGEAAQTATHLAERDRAAAQATRAGKERAEDALKTFYAQVLPANFAGARRVLYLRISQIARDANLQYRRLTFEPEKEAEKRASDVRRLTASVVLEGSYENVRRFIYQLETAPEFVVIDNVSLAMRSEGAAPLVLTVVLSTYYRAGTDAQ
jgi:Tfp pilus assembly protein PilO